MWIGFSQGETDTEAIAVKGTVREKQGKWKKFSHPQAPSVGWEKEQNG